MDRWNFDYCRDEKCGTCVCCTGQVPRPFTKEEEAEMDASPPISRAQAIEMLVGIGFSKEEAETIS